MYSGIIFVGILMAGTGLLILWQIHKHAVRRSTPLAAGLLFLFSGICASLAAFLGNANAAFASVSFGMGCILLLVFIFNLQKVFTCTQTVQGIYCGGNRISSKGQYYSPIFKYQFDGKTYELQSGESYTSGALNRRFHKGNAYDIFISPEKPDLFLCKKQIRSSDVLCFILGVVFIGMSVLLLNIPIR